MKLVAPFLLFLWGSAPDSVIPELRPYRKRGEIGGWFKDSSVIPYLEKQL